MEQDKEQVNTEGPEPDTIQPADPNTAEAKGTDDDSDEEDAEDEPDESEEDIEGTGETEAQRLKREAEERANVPPFNLPADPTLHDSE